MTNQQQQQQPAQQAQQEQPAQPAQQQVQQQAQQPQPQPQPQPLISFNTTAPEQMQAQQAPASYQSIIDQQNEQIAALIAQNQALNGQITKMVQNGAQFYQPQQPAQTAFQPMQPQPSQTGYQQPAQMSYQQAQNPLQQFNPPALSSNQDWSLEALGKEIGKPRKEV